MDNRVVGTVVGCGRMGAFTSDIMKQHAPACWFPLNHAEAMRAHGGIDLAALCDSSAAALKKAAAAHGVAATYTDLGRMLAEVRPSLLGIATRTRGRAGMISEAIEGGVRALHIEKPLCNGAAELAKLRSLFMRTDVFATYGAIRRFLEPYRQAKAMAETGRFGPLREIRVNAGSGALFWAHPHSIDLLLFVAGSRAVTGVQARLANVETGAAANEIDTDPTVLAATLHFDDGLIGFIGQSLGSDLVLSCTEAEIAVRADGGVIDVYAARGGSIFPTLESAKIDRDGSPGGTLAPLTQLVACLEGDAKAMADNGMVKRDILRGQEIALTMVQSHLEESRIVSPGAFDPELFISARTGIHYA